MIRKLPAELGELVEVHRPMRGRTGWIAVLLVPLIFGLFFALGPPGPLIGLIVFLGFLIPIMYATAEWFLLEHRIYRNGIVFGSDLPGLKTYVVPYYTCDPNSFTTIGRKVHDGTDLSQAVGRQYRQCWLTRTNVTFTGLDPSPAMELGSNPDRWRIDVDPPPFLKWPKQRWLFSSRTPQHHIDLLRHLIIASQADHPEWAPKQRPANPTPPY